MTDRQDSYQDDLAEHLQAHGLPAHNNNTGGGVMVVEMYETDSYGPRIIALDADTFGSKPDGTLPPANTFTVVAFAVYDDEEGETLADEATPDEVVRLFTDWATRNKEQHR